MDSPVDRPAPPPREGLDAPPVSTCDGDLYLSSEARQMARRYFFAGFLLLPWFWAVNIWLFFPDFWSSSGDPVVKRYTRRSAVGFVFFTAILLPWMLVYWIGGPQLLGQDLYNKLDVTRLDLASAGLAAN